MRTSKTLKIGGISLVVLLSVLVIASGGAAATHERDTLSNHSVGAKLSGDVVKLQVKETFDSTPGYDDLGFSPDNKYESLTITLEKNSLTRDFTMIMYKKPGMNTWVGYANVSSEYEYLGADPCCAGGNSHEHSSLPTVSNVETTDSSLNTTYVSQNLIYVDEGLLPANPMLEPLGVRSGDPEFSLRGESGAQTDDYNLTLVTKNEQTISDTLTAEQIASGENVTLFNETQDINSSKLWLYVGDEYHFESGMAYNNAQLRFYSEPITHSTDDGSTNDTNDTNDSTNDSDDDPLLGGGGGSGFDTQTGIILIIAAAAVVLVGRS